MDAVKKSVVKAVNANGTWEGQYGLMYKWEVTMENGDSGQYMSKTDPGRFTVGQETAYTLDTSKPDFHKIKPFSEFQASGQNNQFTSKVNTTGGSDVQKMIVKQSSLKAAIEFSKDTNDVNEVLRMADQFVAWVYQAKPVENGQMHEVGSKNDLPF